MNANRVESRLLDLSLLASLLVLALFFIQVGGTKDLNIIANWTNKILLYGFVEGYELIQSDYPPLFFLTIYPFIDSPADNISLRHDVNISSLFFLMLATLCYWRYSRNRLLALMFFLALYLNVALFKYIDINSGFFFMLSMFALLHQRYILFGLLFTLSCLVKWQPLIFAPFLFIYLWKISPDKFKHLASPLLCSALASLSILLPCLLAFNQAIFNALHSVLNEPYLSGNALNTHWITTYVLHLFQPEIFGGLYESNNDYIKNQTWLLSALKIPFVLAYLAALAIFAKGPRQMKELLYFCLVSYLLYFVLNTGVHENHLFFAVLLGFIMLARQQLPASLLLMLSLGLNLNMLLFYGAYGALRNVAGLDITVPFAAIFSAWLLLHCLRFLWQASYSPISALSK